MSPMITKKINPMTTSIKLFIISLFIVFTITLKGQTNFSDKQNWELKILSDVSLGEVKASLNQNFTAYFTKKQIPPELITILQKWNREKITFANPNEDYNDTDVVDGDLPDRQLIAIYKSNRSVFVVYNHGGVGFHQDIIWCKLKENRVIDLWMGHYKGEAADMNKIGQFLNSFSRIHLLRNGKSVKENCICY